MSKYRDWWRPNVDRALRAYPALKEKKLALQSATITPNYNPQPGSGEPSRTTENLATAQLSPLEENWLSAIDRAISHVGRWRDGDTIMRLIKMVYFKRTHTVTGAADATYISESTAKRKIGVFIDLVAKNLGYK